MLLWVTELIGLLFATFCVTIMVIRIARTIRNVEKIRSRHAALHELPPELPRRPSDDFHDQTWLPLCGQVAALAAKRLGRGLCEEERRRVWRSRSQLVLEVLLKELETATPGEAGALLRNAPSGLDRPDPTGWCEGAG